MTWTDVQDFAAPPRHPPGPDLVVAEVQNAATAAVHDRRARHIWSNPVDFLLAYLADPDAGVWGAGAAETVLALLQPGKHGSAAPLPARPESVAAVLASCVEGSAVGDEGPLLVVPRHGRSGLALVVAADPHNHLATLGVLTVLDDRATEVGGPAHEEEWRDWLRWSNVVQFLPLPRVGQELPLRMAEVWTRRSLDVLGTRHLPLALGAAVAAPVVDVAAPAWQVVIEYSHEQVHPLVTALAEADRDPPEPGGEVGDEEVWQVELCWPHQRIAVTVDRHADRDAWLADHGWKVTAIENGTDPSAAAGQVVSWLEESA